LYVPYKVYFLISLFASIIAALGLSALLVQEQRTYHNASDRAKLYLLCIAICDAVYLAMPTKSERDSNTTLPIVVRCVGHSMLFLLECWTGRPTIGAVSRSPEDVYGVLSRAFFTWINPLLVQGYRNVLVDQDLTPLARDMKPALTRKTILESWARRGKRAYLARIVCLCTHIE
jgi:ATP-binding cassette, subfamily C (CFTR/MRP), member 1